MTETERAYYDRRAAEYDDWYLGTGLFAQRVRPGWTEELEKLRAVLGSLRFDSFLDVACGTGYLTESLRGRVIGLDQSASMLADELARMVFLAEARRVSKSMVIIDAAQWDDVPPESIQRVARRLTRGDGLSP
jgi:SAM-dependent methyltransferase